jgi:hypothetical protein
MKFGGKLGDRPPIHWKFSTVTVTGGGWPIELLAGPKYAGGADPQNEHFHRRSLETNMVSSLVPKMAMKNCSIWLVAFPVNPWYRSENGAWGPKKYGHKMMECIRFWDKPERHWCLVCWWNIYIYLLRTVSAWLHLFLGVSVARLPSAAIVSWPCAGVSQPTCAGYLRMISHGIKVLELSNVVSYHDLIPICFWQLACFSSP